MTNHRNGLRPPDEMRMAAHQLETLAQAVLDSMRENTGYWGVHAHLRDADQGLFHKAVTSAFGGPVGELAGLFSPAMARGVAAGLRQAAEGWNLQVRADSDGTEYHWGSIEADMWGCMRPMRAEPADQACQCYALDLAAARHVNTRLAAYKEAADGR